jgi:predicted amidohydrolase YtcJ
MPTAELIVCNGRLVTFDPNRPSAEALAIAGGRILAVGGDRDVLELRGPATRVVDAGGGTVLPGFTNAHVHLFIGAAELDQLNVSTVSGEDALTRAVRDDAAARPGDGLLYANGAFYGMLGPNRPTTRHDLDRILPDRPFAMMAADHHTVWANTPALAAVGLLDAPGARPGGEVVRGADGLASGELHESPAFAPVLAMTPLGGRELLGYTTGEDPDPPAKPAERAIDRQVIARGLRYAAANGITTLHNMDGNFYQLELLAELDAAGELLCRTQVPFHLKPRHSLDRLAEADEMRRRWHSDRLWSGRVKMFMDGVMESRTAFMLAPYPDAAHAGAALFEAEHFDEACRMIDAMGLQISVHAIGDAAVRRTLDGFEAAAHANGARDARHRIEHIECLHPDDLPRFAELGVVASMQPIHAPSGGFFPPPAPDTILRADQLPLAYAWARIRESGARLVFSTDWPVAPIEVGRTLKAAVAPMPPPGWPDQRQILPDALASYIPEAAFAEFTEDRKGRLAPGFLADVVVMAQDLAAMDPATLDQARPVLTVCDGRITFE